MNDLGLFLGKFLKHGTAIASVAPSSRWLARATIGGVDWSTARVVLELGAGTGPITREIALQAHAGCRVLVVERDRDFVSLLRDRYSGRTNLEIIAADAREIGGLLADRGIESVDHVVSGLPVPSFAKTDQLALFRSLEGVLKPDGGYHQITELPLVYWRFYKRFFDRVAFVFEPRNLPPAGAYRCHGLKPGI